MRVLFHHLFVPRGAFVRCFAVVAAFAPSISADPCGNVVRADEPPAATAQTEPDDADWAHIPKEDLRYAGRSFAEWRRQLLTDLEPKTQQAAIEALEAFGSKGYESEAAAALGRVLSTKTDQVRWRAFNALAVIGSKSVPVLIEALRNGNAEVKSSAAATLTQIGPAAEAAIDPLRQAIQDDDRNVRLAAAAALAHVGAGQKRLLPAFEQLARNVDVRMRQNIVWGLSQAGDHPHLLPLFLRELDDEDWYTREAAGKALIRHGPASREVIEGLRQLAREDIERVRLRQGFDATVGGFVQALAHEEKNLQTVAPVLITVAAIVLGDPVFAKLPLAAEVLTGLARLGPTGADAVPALARFIAIDSPATDDSIMLAIDILQVLGPAAREAIPALETWLASAEQQSRDLQSIQKRAAKALRSIAE